MSQKIRRYYEQNDNKFRRWGIDARDHNIHQPLWGAGTKTKRQAANYSNDLVLKIIKDNISGEKDRIKVLDLGSGFGATINHIRSSVDEDAVELSGITISSLQADFASEKLGQNVRVVCGDYHFLSRHFKEMDIIYAIESIVHSRDISGLLCEISSVLAANGLFVVIDDFIGCEKMSGTNHRKIIQDYKENWFVDGLMDFNAFQQIAGENGLILERSDNLNVFVKWYIRSAMTTLLYLGGLRHSENLYIKSLIGGGARQLAIKKGLLDYRIALFRKSQPAASVPVPKASV